MKHRKVILYSLLLPGSISIAFTFKHYTDPFSNKDTGELFLLIVLTFGLWFGGIVLGIILSAIFNDPKKEAYFFLAGQLVIVLGISSFIIYNSYKNKVHEQDFGNIELNHAMVNYDENTSYNVSAIVKEGFKLLESKFQNKNDFILKSYYTQDTLLESRDTLHIIYFTYEIEEENELFSRIDIFKEKATVNILNESTSSNQEYLAAKKKFEKIKKEKLDLINNSLQMATDTSQNQTL